MYGHPSFACLTREFIKHGHDTKRFRRNRNAMVHVRGFSMPGEERISGSAIIHEWQKTREKIINISAPSRLRRANSAASY